MLRNEPQEEDKEELPNIAGLRNIMPKASNDFTEIAKKRGVLQIIFGRNCGDKNDKNEN